jgi:hypothetical protein
LTDFGAVGSAEAVIDPPRRPRLGFARPGPQERSVHVPSRSRAAIALALAALAAACSRPLDIDGLESQLKEQVETELDTTGLTVTCPDDVKAEAGSTFTCEASDPSGATMVITVTQKDDQGNVTWKVTGAAT